MLSFPAIFRYFARMRKWIVAKVVAKNDGLKELAFILWAICGRWGGGESHPCGFNYVYCVSMCRRKYNHYNQTPLADRFYRLYATRPYSWLDTEHPLPPCSCHILVAAFLLSFFPLMLSYLHFPTCTFKLVLSYSKAHQLNGYIFTLTSLRFSLLQQRR